MLIRNATNSCSFDLLVNGFSFFCVNVFKFLQLKFGFIFLYQVLTFCTLVFLYWKNQSILNNKVSIKGNSCVNVFFIITYFNYI